MITQERRRPGRIPGKPAGMDPYERFMTLVDSSGGPEACHIWTATRQRGGYGRFMVGGEKVTATRWLLGHLRGSKLRREATHCRKGHEYTAENTHIRSDNGARRCKTCVRNRKRGPK